MIKDVAHRKLFPTEIMRVVTELDHKAIEQHTINFMKGLPRFTTYHDVEANVEYIKHPEIQKLLVDISDASDQYLVATNRRPFKEEPWIFLWGNVYDENVEHGSHNHPRSIISGTYYANQHETFSSILFDSPLVNMKMHDTQHFDSNQYGVKPVAGDMLLWPSWLFHRVPQQQKGYEVPRVSLSFNLDYNYLRKL